jgi:hypothetical protein
VSHDCPTRTPTRATKLFGEVGVGLGGAAYSRYRASGCWPPPRSSSSYPALEHSPCCPTIKARTSPKANAKGGGKQTPTCPPSRPTARPPGAGMERATAWGARPTRGPKAPSRARAVAAASAGPITAAGAPPARVTPAGTHPWDGTAVTAAAAARAAEGRPGTRCDPRRGSAGPPRAPSARHPAVNAGARGLHTARQMLEGAALLFAVAHGTGCRGRTRHGTGGTAWLGAGSMIPDIIRPKVAEFCF